jgi:hypothetical protein
MKAWMVEMLVVLACVSAQAQESNEPPEITITPRLSISGDVELGATGGDLVSGSVLYWPDYADDGAVGLRVIGGDLVPEDECLLGPAVEFPTGDIYGAAASRILPNAWADVLGDALVQVRPYGAASILFDFEGHPYLVGGTKLRIFPNKKIQPTISTEYIDPAGNARAPELGGWWTHIGVTVFF